MFRHALAVAGLICCGCNPWGSPAGISSTEAANSHRQMVEHLEKIRTDTADQNIYMGDQEVRKLREALAGIDPHAPVAERFHLKWMLGYHELRLGETAQAIADLKLADELFFRAKPSLAPAECDQFLLHLATGHLRLAENQNCIHCQNAESCILPIRGGGVHTKREGSQQTLVVLGRLLEQNPKHLTARWLTNLAHMTLGSYPAGVDPQFRIPETKFQSQEKFPRLKNISLEVGVGEFDLCGGSLIDDFNGDGLLDIVATSWDTAVSVHFFRQNSDGTFTDASKEAGLTGIFGGLSLNQADFDNDGDLDILVMRGAWFGERGKHPCSLLRNDGQGHFQDVTFAAGMGEVHYPAQAGAWADYDNDGDIDLFLGSEAFPSRLYRNDGTGRFTDVAAEAGVTNDRFAKGAVWGDYNGDRLPDLYVSNYGEANRLYRNEGGGKFVDVAPELRVTTPIKSFPVWFWDFDNDGVLDLYVSSWWPDVKYLAAEYFDEPIDAEFMCLYRGNGKGGFDDVATERGLHRYALPMGSNFGDIDSDGFPDFYLGTGYPEYEGLMPNLLYKNKGGKTFADVTFAAGVGHLQKGHGVSFADLDNDGDQDLHVQMGGAFPGDKSTSLLYENPGFGNHTLTLRLVGRTSNRFGVGARIKAEIHEGDVRRTVYSWVNSGGSFGANPLRPQLGLGTAKVVDVLEVYWPTSDTTQRFENVKADQWIEVTEGSQTYKPLTWTKTPFKLKAKPEAPRVSHLTR